MRNLAILGLAACTGTAAPTDPIENPTGECLAEGTGDIECYSFSGPDSQWMLDCAHPLDRTYWRVHAETAADGTVTAWMLPRPDGTGLLYGICDGDDPDLADLFERSGLCVPTLDADGVALVNALPLEDALAISHALHERLVFTPVESGGGWDIAPWLLPEDLEAACPATSVAAACSDYLDAICGDTPLGVSLELDEAGASELAGALNAAYGID